MSEMIACCGLVCSSCSTFLATQNDDDEARKKTAAYYAETFGLSFQPEEINCDGCLSEGGRLLGYCGACGIRKCCREKGLVNCAECEEPCQTLAKFHNVAPDAKACLDGLKREMR